MEVGMLWFDNNPKVDLEEKVKQAAEYYQTKYGRCPNMCFVNPRMLMNKEQLTVGSIRVLIAESILPNHFWLGVTNELQDEKVLAQ
ncbi:MAG: hypothetical protein AB1345_08765 [Chloroflexota bacterium]